MKEVYKRQFKEKSAQDIVNIFFQEYVLKYWDEDGPKAEEDYLKIIKAILSYTSNDLMNFIADDMDTWSDKGKKIANKLLSQSVKSLASY